MSEFNLTLNGVSIGTWQMSFNLAHFLLAMKYKKMIKRITAQLKKRRMKKETQCDKATYWTLATGNVVSGIVYGAAVAAYYSYAYNHLEKPKLGLSTTKFVSSYLVPFFAVISGLMLIASVKDFKKFFKDNDADDQINTPMLVRHAVSFWCYLLGTIANTSMGMLHDFFPKSYTINTCG